MRKTWIELKDPIIPPLRKYERRPIIALFTAGGKQELLKVYKVEGARLLVGEYKPKKT